MTGTGEPSIAALTRLDPPPLRENELPDIAFAFSPERMTYSHSATQEAVLSSAQAEDVIKNLGRLEISIDKVIIVGPETKAQCTSLLWWSTPYTEQVGDQVITTNIDLAFTWGAGFFELVRLRQATVTYTRFNGLTGEPIRAEVRLSMYRGMNPVKPFTNPTSGGPGGRSSHVLDSSECLSSLAASRYGRPGAWRQIARANAIDDPLRVRPGTTVYLPEPGGSGLADGARP